MQQGLDWDQVETVHEICMIAPTLQLAEKARAIIAEWNHMDVDVFVAFKGRREIVECAQTLARKGAKVIISRRGTQQIVEETTDLKVVGLNNTLTDYLRMLKVCTQITRNEENYEIYGDTVQTQVVINSIFEGSPGDISAESVNI